MISKKIFFFISIILKIFLISFLIIDSAYSTSIENNYLYNLKLLKNKNNLQYNYNYACAYTKNEQHDEFIYLLKNKYANALERNSILIYGFSLAKFQYLNEKKYLFSSGINNNKINFLPIPISELKYINHKYEVFEYDIDSNIIIKYSIKIDHDILFKDFDKFYLLKEVFSLKEKIHIDKLNNFKSIFTNLKSDKDYVDLLNKLREYTEINLSSSNLINKTYYVCGLYK